MTEPKQVTWRFDERLGYTLHASQWPHETLYGPIWNYGRLSRWATENGYVVVREEAAQPKG